MPRYYVKSPLSGNWMQAPGLGSTPDIRQAHAYPMNDPVLREMVEFAKAHKILLRLRQC